MDRYARNTNFTPRRSQAQVRSIPADQRGRPTRPSLDGFDITKKHKFNFSQPAAVAPQQVIKTDSVHRRLGKVKPAKNVQSLYTERMFEVPPPRRWQTPDVPTEPTHRLAAVNISNWFRKQTRPQLAMLAAAGFIFIFGLTASIMGFRTNSHVEAETKKMSQNAGEEDAGDHPDETEPGFDAIAQYQVDLSSPRRISIPKLGINARIKPLGTKKNNELKAPANIYDAGWFERSAKPGEQGATLIDGHVHGPTKPGIFYNLKKLGIGEIIEIERGDGEIFRYEVIRTQTFKRDDMDMKQAVSPIDSALPGLNIITCTGQLDKANNTYTDRLLVQAVLVD